MQSTTAASSGHSEIDLAGSIASPVKRRLYGLPGLEKLLAVPELHRRYAESRAQTREGAKDTHFFSAALRALGLEYRVRDEDLARIPAEGPVLLVANHPFGVIDALVLGDLVTRRRSDVRLLGNNLIGAVPELAHHVVPVAPFGPEGTARNVAAAKTSLRWLRGGGALAAFPAGAVSGFDLRVRAVTDPPWHESVAALARRTNATVVPVWFEGRNSNLFQIMGLVARGLRSALLLREAFRRSETTLEVRVGKPIAPSKLADLPDDATRIQYLRFKTYSLEHRGRDVKPRFRAKQVTTEQAPLASPVPPALLAAEIARLPKESVLIEQGPFEVRVASWAQIPALMREIGYLREKTFRAVGEGTGRSLDLDTFDESYHHLFMWNRDTQELVGSYRIGFADKILARDGQRGLYTSTLFKWKGDFLERLNPALELGRSFIRAEYQRKHTSLALIWRGIGELLVRNPQYKTLFGPVSISQDYADLSKQLMVEYLEEHNGDDALGALVKAKMPPRARLGSAERAALSTIVRDVDELSSLIADIEEDDKGLPVLLKHYLKLNARLVAFNLDPEFGNCLDGLIVVDLRTTDPKILKRFMGETGYQFFTSV